jgi:hypothetical protein
MAKSLPHFLLGWRHVAFCAHFCFAS